MRTTIKVKPPLHKLWSQTGGVEVQLHSFFTSDLDAPNWSASSTVALPPEKDPPVPIQQKAERASEVLKAL